MVVLPSYFLEHYTDLHDRVGLATAGDTIHVEQQLTHSSKKVTSPSPQSSNSSTTVPSNCALASSSSTGCGVGVGGAGVSRSALDGVPGESPKRHRLFRGVSGAVAIGRGSVSGDSAFAGE
jgi:hypothetical protein